MSPSLQFPFLSEFLDQKFGTLYVLCDSAVRLRDALSVMALTRFFAERGVDVRVRPVLAKQRRFLSARDVQKSFSAETGPDAARIRLDLENARRSDISLEEFVEKFFESAERASSGESIGSGHSSFSLAPRGPLLILGRPTLYPSEFVRQVTDELKVTGKGIYGRFVAGNDDHPEQQDRPFWSVSDRYYNIRHDVTGRREQFDYGIVRKVRGAFDRRTMLFAYGTSSLGTYGAVQLLIDEDQNQRLNDMKLDAHLRQHGEVEVLIETDRSGSSSVATDHGHLEDLTPRELRVFVGPAAPVSASATEWIERLTGHEDDTVLGTVYQRKRLDDPNMVCFTVVGAHPHNAISVRSIGGDAVRKYMDMLRDLVADSRRPILLVGAPGVGKELAARAIYETRVLLLIEALSSGEITDPGSLFLGARFQAINCAGMTEELAESRLFGIRENAATHVNANPGVILGAGEGVAFLDEVAFMNALQQGRLLRAIEPPFYVTPLGSSAVPYGAQVVTAMSSQPHVLVEEGRMLPELVGRLHAGTVEIPSVIDRPGDVPALLTEFAGRAVEMDETVLRCLIADSHPMNVRGLFSIVARAKRREPKDKPAPSSLEITLDDLLTAADLLDHITTAAPGAGRRRFLFEPAGGRLVPPDVFEDAAHVLTSVAGKDAEPLKLRPIPKLSVEFGTSDLHLGTLDAAARLWVGAVGRVVQRFPVSADRENCLVRLGQLCKKRFGARAHRSRDEGDEATPRLTAFARALDKARDDMQLSPKGAKGSRQSGVLYDEDLARSIGQDPAWWTRHMKHAE